MTDASVHEWIDRWQDRGLLSPEVARRLHDDVDAGAAPSHDERSAVERALAAARGGVLEALGYLGTAVTLGAFAVLFDLPSWSDATLLGLTVLVAVVTAAGLFRLTPPVAPAGRRLGGVLGLTSVVATALALVQAFEPACGQACTYWHESVLPALLSAATTGVAAVLYRRHVHLLTHAALAVSTAVLAATVGLVLAGPAASTEAEDAWIGALLLATSLAWVWACETDRLRPAWLGTLAAGGLSYAAVFMITSPWVTWVFGTRHDDLAVLAVLALASAHTVVGAVTARLRPTIVGAAGLAVSVPWTLTDVVGLDATTTAGVLLPVGIALTAWAVLAGRRTAERT